MAGTSLQSQRSALNLTSATVLNGAGLAGRIATVCVVVAGTAAGSVCDCPTTGAASLSNEIFSIPNTVGVYQLDFPYFTGLTVVPGTGQTITVAFR